MYKMKFSQVYQKGVGAAKSAASKAYSAGKSQAKTALKAAATEAVAAGKKSLSEYGSKLKSQGENIINKRVMSKLHPDHQEHVKKVANKFVGKVKEAHSQAKQEIRKKLPESVSNAVLSI